MSRPSPAFTRPQPCLYGLYAITANGLIDSIQLMERVGLAIQGGARLIQYRDKSQDRQRREQQARALVALCHAQQVPLIVNDDVALAEVCGADGVHLGQDDATLAEARRRLGAKAIIGVSCYNSFERAEQAVAGDADYIAFGRFFASHTKPGAVSADLDLLRETKARLNIPLAAIGGITPVNGDMLIEAGADMLAVVQGVFGAPDPRAAARSYSRLFK